MSDTHKRLIEDKLQRGIVGLELQCNFGMRWVYVFWYEDGDKVLYSVATIVGGEAHLIDFGFSTKEATAEAVGISCDNAKEDDETDGTIVRFDT